MQTAWKETGHAFQWTVDCDDFLSKVIKDTDGERSQRAAALTRQAVILLHRIENVLTHGVTNLIFIVALEAYQSCTKHNERELGTYRYCLMLYCTVIHIQQTYTYVHLQTVLSDVRGLRDNFRYVFD